MPICSVCSAVLPSLKLLLLHYQFIHSFKEKSRYQCNEDNCCRLYSSLNSFKKHFNSVHSIRAPETYGIPSSSSHDTRSTVSYELQDNSVNLSNPDHYDLEDVHYVHPSTLQNLQTCLDDSIDVNQFKENLTKQIALLFSNLYEKTNVPRNIVQSVITNVHQTMILPVKFMQQQMCHFLSIINEQGVSLVEMRRIIDDIFNNMSSEYRRLKYLESTCKLIKPEEIDIGQYFVINANGDMKPKSLTYQYISISKVLQCFFETDNVFLECNTFYSSLVASNNEAHIANIIQGTLWSSKNKTVDLTFPLLIYYDDFEIGNALGSHAGIHKLGAVYYSIPAVPPMYNSELDNIFLAMLFHSDDMRIVGNNRLFSKLIGELNMLQNVGILVNVNTQVINIKFQLTLIQGDNLGLHTILGFTQSFNSTLFCRFCKITKTEAATQVALNNNLVRSRDNYDTDVLQKNVRTTGIKENCVFNDVGSFHVLENYVTDIMHDLLEGVCKNVVACVLHQFIFVENIISMDVLNSKISFFPLGFERCNRPTSFSTQNVQQKQIKASASEMLCLCRYLCIMLGDLVPKANQHWKLYIYLRKIISIVTSPKLLKDTSRLKNIIAKHHQLYLELVPTAHLTPKFHYLLHLPDIIGKTGPPIHLWCMRYEAKHKQLKSIANAVSSRINITKTIALKHQLGQCMRFLSNRGFSKEICHGKAETFSTIEELGYTAAISILLRMQGCTESVTKVNIVTIHGIKYRLGNIIIIPSISVLPKFGKIEGILISNDKVHMLYSNLLTDSFNEHLQSYQVTITSDMCTITHDELQYLYPVLCTLLSDGNTYITLRHEL